MSKLDFERRCVFGVGYPSLGKNLCLVEMESGKKAIYKVITSGYYGGTRQMDYEYKFIKFINDDELNIEHCASVDPKNNYRQIIYRLKDEIKIDLSQGD